MKSLPKLILSTAAVLAAVVVIVVCGLIFWIKSNTGLQWIQSRIDAAIPGKISIQSHRLALAGLRLDLYDAVLYDSGGTALAGFGHLSVKLDGRALWHREIRLVRILLQAPWADMRVDKRTGLNLVAALVPPTPEKQKPASAPQGAGLPFNVVIESMQLTRGRVTFTPAAGKPRLEADGIDISAGGDLMARSAHVKLAVAGVRLSGADIHPRPVHLDVTARLDGDKLLIPAFAATSGQTELELSGSADHLYSAPQVNASLSVATQLEELKRLFDLPGDYDGRMHADLTVRGGVANPHAELRWNFDGGRIAGQALDRAAASIDLEDRQATLTSLSLQRAQGKLNLDGTVDLRQAFPSGFLAPPADLNTITYTLTLVPTLPDLKPWLSSFLDVDGRLNGRTTLTGQGIDLPDVSARLTLTASGEDLLARGMDRPVNAEVNLTARVDRGQLSISNLNAAADGIDLTANGRFQIDSRALAGQLSISAQDLSRALTVVGIPAVKGAGKATLTVAGSLNRPQFTLDLQAANLAVAPYTLGDLTVNAAMDKDGRLNVTTLGIQNRGSQIHANGRLRLLPDGGGIDPTFNNHLELTFEGLSPGDFMHSPSIRGTLDGRLQATGPLESLEGGLSLDGRQVGTAAVTIGSVAARLRLKGGNVVVDRLRVQNKKSTFSANGHVGLLIPGSLRLLEDPTFDVRADSDHFDPQDFLAAPINGDFSLDTVLTGSVAHPAGKLNLTGRKILLADQPLARMSLGARLQTRRLSIDKLAAVVVDGERIDASGWIDLDKRADLHIESKGISAAHIRWLHDYFPGQGKISFNATAHGSLENPDADGHLSVTDIIINQEAMQDVDLTFSLHDMLAKVAGNLNFGVNAACDLKKGDFDVRLRFDKTETATYFKIAGKPDLHGTLSGSLQASGNLHDPTDVSAHLRLNALQLMVKNTSLIRSDRIVLQLVDRKLSVPGVNLALLTEGSLHLQGEARLGGPVDVAIDGRIPLAAAGALTDSLANAGGALVMTGRVTGTSEKPQIDGRIDVENVSMPIPGLVQKLHDLNGRILLTANRINLDNLSGSLGTGKFSLSGNVEHDMFTPTQVNLNATARSLPLEVPDTLSVLFNADIRITGDNRSADANGQIMLLQGVYYKDVKINLLKLATTRTRAVAPPSPPISLPYFGTVNLDLSVGYREPFTVQNNLADLEINPDLHIGGTLAQPIVSGRAQVSSGTITFQKKTFEVKKGVVDFVNPYKTEAHIDIESVTTIRTWTITLTIKGTPDNLDLQLSSVPSETDSDILSLILFGRTAQELSGGEGAAKRSTGQILTELIADTFGEEIKKNTGVDILQVETTGNGDNQETGGVQVTVGKHLSNRMTVKYSVETQKGELVQRAIAEYKLLENILVSGFQDTKGIYGSELVFRIEFR